MNFELLVNTIEQTHLHFQKQASRAVNVNLTLRNWFIGYYIVEFEQNGEDRAKYGEKLLKNLALKCKGINGTDERSLRNFRTFYYFYPQIKDSFSEVSNYLPKWGTPSPIFNDDNSSSIRETPSPILQNVEYQLNGKVLIQKLNYSQIELLLKIHEPIKRVFYEMECIKGTWSVRELKRQINSLFYERSGMSLKPELLSETTQNKAEKLAPNDIVKTVYAFEFLGLKIKDTVEETDLETALIDNLQEFMMEMGHGFCLEARQKKILIGDEYFYIDLVFYHRILKCHVLVELKVENFNHENIGQLNSYVNYFKAEVMQPTDNPTVGILLVTDKNTTLVEYATAGMGNELFVSKYLLELPPKEKLVAFIQNELKKWND